MPEFVRDLEGGQAKRIYQAAQRPSLLTTPLPEFHLAELGRYSMMTVQYSRGGPFQSEFCDVIKIYGRVPRTKSVVTSRDRPVPRGKSHQTSAFSH